MTKICIVMLAGLVMTPPPAQSQTQAQPIHSSRFGHGPDSIPDLTNRFIVVYGLQPFNDSAAALLRRRGLRVADRSPAVIERAQRERRRLEPARYGILVEVRYDSLARARIIRASLLDIETTSRLRMTSVLYPAQGVWGPAMDSVMAQLLARPVRR